MVSIVVLIVSAADVKHSPYGLCPGRNSPYGLCRGRKATLNLKSDLRTTRAVQRVCRVKLQSIQLL